MPDTTITINKRILDDEIFRACEAATTTLSELPLRTRALFTIEASTKIMEAVEAHAIATPPGLIPRPAPNKPKPRPPRLRTPATTPPPAPGTRPTLTPAADISPAVLNAPLPTDAAQRAEAQPMGPPFGEPFASPE